MSSPALPLVSVVIPAYRQAAFVSGCLDSVAAQSYQGPTEVIVVDDGCPEQTAEVAARHPSTPIVLRQENSGVAKARNAGIARATGTFIAFCDADDRWHEHKLEQQLDSLMRLGRPALGCTRYRRVDASGQALEPVAHPPASLEPSLEVLMCQNFVGCSTVVVHRDCLAAVGGFPDSAELRRGGQDYALWLAIAARFPIAFVPEILVDYAIHEASRVGTDRVKNFDGAVHALRWFHGRDRDLFTAAGGAYPRLVARHAGAMFRDLARQRASVAMVRRALASSWAALRASEGTSP